MEYLESGDSEPITNIRKWFWWVLERMTNEEKQDLIYFWTGSPALPASEEGFQPMPSVTIRPRDDNFFVTANTYVQLFSAHYLICILIIFICHYSYIVVFHGCIFHYIHREMYCGKNCSCRSNRNRLASFRIRNIICRNYKC